ncbi:MAG: DNA alkylation repair protein [Rikenellaceae bacterium]
MSHNSRLAYLLGEMRRQMNGAVVGSMRFYGKDYGLNYGVNIPTIRTIAREEAAKVEDRAANHKFAKQLYVQQVRELQLAALWFADAQQICDSEQLRWWGDQIINSEMAEEVAFVLMQRVSIVDKWLDAEHGELLQYCALLAIVKQCERVDDKKISQKEISHRVSTLWPTIISLTHTSSRLLPKAVVSLLDTAHRCGMPIDQIKEILATLPADSPATHYICDEMEWRMEL